MAVTHSRYKFMAVAPLLIRLFNGYFDSETAA
jgi:hypothetical protein